MEDLTEMLIKNLENYELWLESKGINPENIRENAKGNHKKILLRAFRRHSKNWNITKIQADIIMIYKEKRSMRS